LSYAQRRSTIRWAIRLPTLDVPDQREDIGKTDLAAFAALFRARKSLLLRQI